MMLEIGERWKGVGGVEGYRGGAWWMERNRGDQIDVDLCKMSKKSPKI